MLSSFYKKSFLSVVVWLLAWLVFQNWGWCPGLHIILAGSLTEEFGVGHHIPSPRGNVPRRPPTTTFAFFVYAQTHGEGRQERGMATKGAFACLGLVPLRLARASSTVWGQRTSAIIQSSGSLEPVARKQGVRHVHPWGEQVSRPAP